MEVIKHENGTWGPFEHFKRRQELEKEFRDKMWKGIFTGVWDHKEPSPDNNVKLAWVVIAGDRRMIGVDNKTMQGYEMNETSPTWKKPLVPTQYDSFERWCTSFDV